MTFEQFKQYLSKIDKMSVPGNVAHLSLTSVTRKKVLDTIERVQIKAREAGVLILLFPKDGNTHMVLIQRPIYKGVHSGQIALPGGKVEKEDNSLEETALRETWEEVGVVPENITIVKKMTKVYIPPSNFWVYPYLGYSDVRPDFKRQEEEVAAILEIPVEKLLDDANLTVQKISNSYVTEMEVPSFLLNDYMVWGATAMMLNEFKVFLKTIMDS